MQTSKGIRRGRQKIEEVKKLTGERREQKKADLDVEKAAAERCDEAAKAKKLEQKYGMASVMTLVEKDSRWTRAKSWVGRLVWRPKLETEKRRTWSKTSWSLERPGRGSGSIATQKLMILWCGRC